jgi:hypothetical protein
MSRQPLVSFVWLTSIETVYNKVNSIDKRNQLVNISVNFDITYQLLIRDGEKDASTVRHYTGYLQTSKSP